MSNQTKASSSKQAIKPTRVRACLPLVLAALCGLFLHAPAALAEDVRGEVLGLYYEAGPGVLSGSPMLGMRLDARRWADVELDPAESGEIRRVLVQVPEGTEPHVGDRVGVEMGAERRSTLLARSFAPMQRVAHITTVRPAILAGVR